MGEPVAVAHPRLRALLARALGFLAALALGAAVMWLAGAPPLAGWRLLASGAFGSPEAFACVLVVWAPVLLCCAGLLLTFAAGLWNIGIEGQVVLGAVCATGCLRATQDVLPPAAALCLAALAAGLGGACWALLAGGLKRWGGVHEIFGGLGLNFIAGSLVVYLVLGPWQPPGTASTSGTEPFPSELWLSAFPGFRVSPVELLIGLLALLLAALALRGTSFGLRLRALGAHARPAFLLGLPTARCLLLAFGLCGALAGLAGWVLVVGASAHHKLYPLISSGYGFQALLVVLLAGRSAVGSAAVSLAFAVLARGSLQLTLEWGLDSALGGVLQGLLVLAVLVAQGVQARRARSGE